MYVSGFSLGSQHKLFAKAFNRRQKSPLARKELQQQQNLKLSSAGYFGQHIRCLLAGDSHVILYNY